MTRDFKSGDIAKVRRVWYEITIRVGELTKGKTHQHIDDRICRRWDHNKVLEVKHLDDYSNISHEKPITIMNVYDCELIAVAPIIELIYSYEE